MVKIPLKANLQELICLKANLQELIYLKVTPQDIIYLRVSLQVVKHQKLTFILLLPNAPPPEEILSEVPLLEVIYSNLIHQKLTHLTFTLPNALHRKLLNQKTLLLAPHLLLIPLQGKTSP